MLSVIVPAAGSSLRMGDRNKLLLPYKDKTILSHTLEEILTVPHFREVIVVTGFESDKIAKSIQYLDQKITIVHNDQHLTGLTSTIRTGVSQASGTGYMICLPDMVYITASEYRSLQNSFEHQLRLDEKCIGIPLFDSKKGNPVIFSSWYRDLILTHEENEGCKGIVNRHNGSVRLIEMSTPHILMDIDYPIDYETLTTDR